MESSETCGTSSVEVDEVVCLKQTNNKLESYTRRYVVKNIIKLQSTIIILIFRIIYITVKLKYGFTAVLAIKHSE